MLRGPFSLNWSLSAVTGKSSGSHVSKPRTHTTSSTRKMFVVVHMLAIARGVHLARVRDCQFSANRSQNVLLLDWDIYQHKHYAYRWRGCRWREDYWMRKERKRDNSLSSTVCHSNPFLSILLYEKYMSLDLNDLSVCCGNLCWVSRQNSLWNVRSCVCILTLICIELQTQFCYKM